MSHRQVRTIALFIPLILIFFSLQSKVSSTPTPPPLTIEVCQTKQSLEEVFACFHLVINSDINNAVKDLKYIYSKDSKLTPVDKQKLLKAPPEAKPAPCLVEVEKIQNLSSLCLLIRTLDKFDKLEATTNRFTAMVMPTQQTKYKNFVKDHKLQTISTIHTALQVYNQLYTAYPMHKDLEKMAVSFNEQIQTLTKVSSSIKKYNLKFPNASTTECE
jgi:hypothetical protein